MSSTLEIKDENDMDGFLAILNSKEGKPYWEDRQPSFVQMRVLRTTWTDCPTFVINEVRVLWRNQDLGNDNYYARVKQDSELFEDYPGIYMWAKHNGIADNEEFLVHYWW